jgi:RecA/RadA recombinase
MDDNRKKALTAALGQIEKQFGKGSVMRLGDSIASRDIDVVSTGSLGLDVALGIGGLPRGRVVEIYGPESSGKTTLTLQVVAEIQRIGGTAAAGSRGDRSAAGGPLPAVVGVAASRAFEHPVIPESTPQGDRGVLVVVRRASSGLHGDTLAFVAA